MIWILGYLVIGLALSLYLPFTQRRTKAKAAKITPERWALMTPAERKTLEYFIRAAQTPFKTWHLVIAGILWPTQIVGWIIGDIFARRLRRRNRCDHDDDAP